MRLKNALSWPQATTEPRTNRKNLNKMNLHHSRWELNCGPITAHVFLPPLLTFTLSIPSWAWLRRRYYFEYFQKTTFCRRSSCSLLTLILMWNHNWNRARIFIEQTNLTIALLFASFNICDQHVGIVVAIWPCLVKRNLLQRFVLSMPKKCFVCIFFESNRQTSTTDIIERESTAKQNALQTNQP